MKSLVTPIKMQHKATRLLRSISPKVFLFLGLQAVTSALLPYVTVFFSARILSELAGTHRESVLWNLVILGVASTGVLAIAAAYTKEHATTLFDDLWSRKDLLFIRKAFSMDFQDVDSQTVRDARVQIQQSENFSGFGLARVPSYYRMLWESLIGIASGIGLSVGLFTAKVPEGSLQFLSHPLFLAGFLILLLAVCFLSGRFVAAYNRYFAECTGFAVFGNRLFDHFTTLGMDKSRSVDVRMYEQQAIAEKYWAKNDSFRSRGILGQLERGKMGITMSLSVSISALITGAVYVFTCLKAWGGAFDIGMVTQYVGAATALAGSVRLAFDMWSDMKANAPFLEKALTYLELPNSMYQGSLTTEKRADRQYEVEFKNVSFRYPGSKTWALKDVSLKFRIGRRLAIVGENGSGKTTFIKLLCRLYDPQEGEILLNGINIRKYNYHDYMELFAVVFQDFQLLSQPLGENVAGSRIYDAEKVTQALSDAGFGERLKSLPDGVNTQLYKDFGEDGVVLSGGEAQKVAIARALYKDAPFIILDEPTAALDPIAEAEIYERFDLIVTDKTAVYISHRLSSCKFCDEIAVFDHGSIVQFGTHSNLIAEENGKYHELWSAQAQYYTTGSER